MQTSQVNNADVSQPWIGFSEISNSVAELYRGDADVYPTRRETTRKNTLQNKGIDTYLLPGKSTKVVWLDHYKEDVIGLSSKLRPQIQDATLAEIRAFSCLEDDWDGDGGVRPPENVISDAVATIQMWPRQLGTPFAEPDTSGGVTINTFDAEGLISLAIDFAVSGRASYAVMDGSKVLDTGNFDSKNQLQIIEVYEKIQRLLATE